MPVHFVHRHGIQAAPQLDPLRLGQRQQLFERPFAARADRGLMEIGAPVQRGEVEFAGLGRGFSRIAGSQGRHETLLYFVQTVPAVAPISTPEAMLRKAVSALAPQ
jgi:hypothetical protein